jgi:KaiC/GvpD/RAD55 family RecA-like ATPase
MAREYRREVTVVYGQTGSGKTVLARALFSKRIKALGLGAIGIIVDTLQEHVDVPAVNPRTFENFLSLETGKARTARVLLDSEADFDEFAVDLENSYTAPSDGRKRRGPVVLMIDEVSYWTSPGKSTAGLSRLIRYGRHWQVDLIGVARRPAETSRELSAQSTMLYIVGGIVEPRDVQYMKQVLPAEALSKSLSLSRFHYLKYSTDGVYTVCQPVKI